MNGATIADAIRYVSTEFQTFPTDTLQTAIVRALEAIATELELRAMR